MSRDIKFRAWDKEMKNLYSWDAVQHWDFATVEWLQYDFLQYTGLKDKNGKEIYEGDVIQFPYKTQYKVMWSESNAGWFLIHAKGEGDKYGVYTRNIALNEEKEIIGNIYENPELLKP